MPSRANAIVVFLRNVYLMFQVACLVSLNRLATMGGDGGVTLAVFVPTSCTDIDYNETIAKADADCAEEGEPSNDIVVKTYNSCPEAPKTLQRIASAISHPNTVLVGPGQRSLCEVTARFLARKNRALFSWACVGDELALGHSAYRTLSRSGASAVATASALADILYDFRWQYVTLVLSTELPSSSYAVSLQQVLLRRGFVVTDVIYFVPSMDAAQLADQLKGTNDTTKAVVICVPPARTLSALVAAHTANLLNEHHAVILLPDTSSYLSAVRGIHTISATLSLNADKLAPIVGNKTTAARMLQAVFVLSSSAHAYTEHPSLNRTATTSTTTAAAKVTEKKYSESLYNAIRLAYSAIRQVLANASDVSNGEAVTNAASNTSFTGLNGRLVTNADGEVVMRFVLWDYRTNNDTYESVREVTTFTDVVQYTGTIIWPNLKPLAGDECAFEICTSGMHIGHIFAILTTISLCVIIVISIAIYVKRRMVIRAMQTGPNKMLLYAEDLTFVGKQNKTDNFFKGSHLTDPSSGGGFMTASSRSLSDRSIVEHNGVCDTARYNGDIVFVKQLHIKGFEMSGNVRLYIKQLRDVRHENIVAFIGCFINPSKLAFIWEYCSRKSLEDVIHNENIKLDWDFKLSLLTDLVKGMKYIHSSSLKCHGSLKSGNCVIDSRWVLKVTDYGVNGMYGRFKAPRDRQPNELLWTAPELLRNTDQLNIGSQQGDVYSFAIIMQEVIVRGYPFCMIELDASEIIRKVKSPPPLCRPSVSHQMAPPQYIQIMKQCWAEKRQMRPDFVKIHQEFKNVTKGQKMNIVDTMFKMLEKYSNDLEEIVRERTVALEEEKKKSENLLSQMLPPSVAESLLRGEPVEAESFADVTIYFSDIVGFTTISAMSTPIQVVNLLNDLYTMFDATIDDYDVYKVETIGDAYMVVSGLPVPNGHLHAGEISTMALDLLSKSGQFTIKHMPDVPLRLRIGIHTGHCVSGVVGLRMPRYCLFGDTVNTASRMESSGFAFRIHVSESTKCKLDILGGYHVVFRGEVELKGRGQAKTFWLTGKDGFTKPLPSPPDSEGSNHGLESLMKDRILGVSGSKD